MARGPLSNEPISRERVLAFIRDSEEPIGLREIARAFGAKGPDRAALRSIVRELENEGAVDRGARRRIAAPGTLPEVAVLHVTGRTTDGTLLAEPANWRGQGETPTIHVAASKRSGESMGNGARVLARLSRTADGGWQGDPIRVLGAGAQRVMALVERSHDGLRLRPLVKGARETYLPSGALDAPLTEGEVVEIETGKGRRSPRATASVVRRIGLAGEPHLFSEMAIQAHDIPHDFPAAALEEADAAVAAPDEDREDLRPLPLVTIDGADARDFDDAVFAERDPEAPDGWHAIVAIADVAWYVRPASALDREARARGNSVYFPDRVVPMLPEQLSNDLCSLRPDEDRPCLAAHLWFDRMGHLRRHRFVRGVMRSRARLTYEAVQSAIDGTPDAQTAPLVETVIDPLFSVFRALEDARRTRGALDIELPEMRIDVDRETGQIRGIAARERLDAHKIIEELMIAANVAAAETLESAKAPCLFRVHDEPDAGRAEALREFLAEIGIKVGAGGLARPGQFNDILKRAYDQPFAEIVNELVLRSQSQARYDPDNHGHFGLALDRYAHFTSPIRRYSDLLVHRSLITSLGLGAGGLGAGEGEEFDEAGEHLSTTERRASAAERETVDRFVAAYLSNRVGDEFQGRVTGVARFGLFVRLEGGGGDGLLPIGRLPDDFYEHDAARHQLAGRHNGIVLSLGDSLAVRLVAADAMTGSLLLDPVDLPQNGRRSRHRKPGRGNRTRAKKSNSRPRSPDRRGGRR